MGAPYFFEDFTEAHYRFLLRLARSSYRFAGFDDAHGDGRIVLWRHDVDMSVERAERIAHIEAEEGVRATYFVLFHSDFYNVLERSVSDRVRRLCDLGHDVALHFDASYYGDTPDLETLAVRLRAERAMLEDLIGGPVRSFAYHNPDKGDLLRFDQDVIAGMVNAYGRTIRSGFGYCSDSNGYWRYRRLVEVLQEAEAERLQILTHPVWWQEAPMSPLDRVRRSVSAQTDTLLNTYAWALDAQGRKNVS